ncbi:Hypothetical predicted protein [Mytilus galloprovincialis]|nr:Hypothetical predicted protein [Mytilus galloprovincialis]
MKFLRHEEFEKGCEAACNGPYDGKWSKSMVGYGPEDSHFVVELTYNYGIGAYKLGNDFRGITIHSKDIIRNANKLNYPVVTDGESQILTSPDGYKFIVMEKETEGENERVENVEDKRGENDRENVEDKRVENVEKERVDNVEDERGENVEDDRREYVHVEKERVENVEDERVQIEMVENVENERVENVENERVENEKMNNCNLSDRRSFDEFGEVLSKTVLWKLN